MEIDNAHSEKRPHERPLLIHFGSSGSCAGERRSCERPRFEAVSSPIAPRQPLQSSASAPRSTGELVVQSCLIGNSDDSGVRLDLPGDVTCVHRVPFFWDNVLEHHPVMTWREGGSPVGPVRKSDG
jgi:hypothetical protein